MKNAFLGLAIIFIWSLSIQAQSIVGNWKLTSILIEWDMAFPVMAPITLKIDKNGKIGGNGGCNGYGGSYSFKKPNKVKFTDIISTQMFCEEASNSENRFFQSLREAKKIVVKNGELMIENSTKGNTLRFVREDKLKT